MSEQQPHLEILSRNRVSRSTIVVTIVPISVFSGLAAIALWPYLAFIGYGLLTLSVLGACYLIAIAAIDVRRRWIHAHVIHLGEHGVIDALSWRMLPLALPAPHVTVTPEDPESQKKWEDSIRDAYAHGQSEENLAKAFQITRHQVRKILGKA